MGWLSSLRRLIRSVRMRRPRAILGHLDAPRHALGPVARVIVRGWAIDADNGAAVAVRIRVGGRTIAPLLFAREDVVTAFSNRFVTVDCGFWSEIDLFPGLQRLRVEALSGKGWCLIGARFIIGRSIAAVDRPFTYAEWKSADKALLMAEADEIKRHIASSSHWPTFTVAIGQGGGVRAGSLSAEDIQSGTILLAPDAIISFEALIEQGPKTDFIVFLGSGDRLSGDALYRFAAAHIAHPGADVFYGDEELQIDGSAPLLRAKPDWSPDAFHHADYIGSGICVRGAIVQSYLSDNRERLLSQILLKTDQVVHLRRVLCEVTSKSAIGSAGSPNRLQVLPESNPRMSTPPGNAPNFVSICLRDPGVSATSRQRGVEVTIVSCESESREASPDFEDACLRVNQAALSAHGEDLLVFSDGGILEDDFSLRLLATCFERDRVGAAGPKRIGFGVVEHGMMFRRGYWVPIIEPENYEASAAILANVRNVSAVRFDGLVIRAKLFHQLGGFGPARHTDLAAANLCERIYAGGGTVISVPFVSMTASDPTAHSASNFLLRSDRGTRAYSDTRDPYYNDFALAGDPADFRTSFASPRT